LKLQDRIDIALSLMTIAFVNRGTCSTTRFTEAEFYVNLLLPRGIYGKTEAKRIRDEAQEFDATNLKSQASSKPVHRQSLAKPGTRPELPALISHKNAGNERQILNLTDSGSQQIRALLVCGIHDGTPIPYLIQCLQTVVIQSGLPITATNIPRDVHAQTQGAASTWRFS
jgi:hypothetical protein